LTDRTQRSAYAFDLVTGEQAHALDTGIINDLLIGSEEVGGHQHIGDRWCRLSARREQSLGGQWVSDGDIRTGWDPGRHVRGISQEHCQPDFSTAVALHHLLDNIQEASVQGRAVAIA